MEMDIKTPLNEEIVDEFKQLKGIDVGTEEYKLTVEGLTKLMDRAIEIEKFEHEQADKLAKAEIEKVKEEAEEQFRNGQIKREERDRLIKDCISVAGLIINVGLVVWGTVKSFEFEREGTITTIMGRGFINKLLPKK